MNNRQRLQQALRLLEEEHAQPERWWYLSFNDHSGFLGGLFIKAHGIVDGVMKARRQRLNPDGEVTALPCPDESKLPPEEFRNRLLTKADLEEMNKELNDRQ
jgi:hypothetical protein